MNEGSGSEYCLIPFESLWEIIRTYKPYKGFKIQWALDIIPKFPKEENVVRMSTNLEEWIEKVADEDDREQIGLWAKQVMKGKITEEEFGEKVSNLK